MAGTKGSDLRSAGEPSAGDRTAGTTRPPPLVARPEAASGSGVLFALMTVGYPVAWVLGLGPAVFPFAALLMVVWLIRYRPLRIPPGTVFLALFLIVVLASITQVGSASRLAVWLMRTSWYFSAVVAVLYLARQTGPKARLLLIRAMIGYWVLAVIGGWAAIVAPDLTWPTPLLLALPDSIASDAFVQDLIVPRAAEVQMFWTGVRLNRPAAPFAYTNAWGSSIALLTPFLLAGWRETRIGLSRKLIVTLLIVGFVPFYVALNRGAWLTLGLGLVYAAARSAFVRGHLKPVLVLIAGAVIGLTMVFNTGAVDTARAQLETRTADSNETRVGIYVETMTESARSPIIGFGTPRPNPSNPDGPPLGTHGQLWAVMFAHGYLGLALYLAFFLHGFLRARGVGPIGHWAKVSLLIGLLQLPIYGHLPTQLFVLVGAVTMASWPEHPFGPDQAR